VLAIEEISMLNADLFTKLDAVFSSIRRAPDLPFGGVTLAVSGDFMQLPPVDGTFAFCSPAWERCRFVQVPFTQPHRYVNDPGYADMLLRVRVGRPTQHDLDALRTRVGAVVGGHGTRVRPTTLFPHRADVDRLNAMQLNALAMPEQVYRAVDTEFQRPEARAGTGFRPPARRTGRQPGAAHTNALDSAIPREVRLRVGAQVMLKKNLDVAGGLANGTRGVVIDMDNEGATIETSAGRRVEITMAEWTAGTEDAYVVRQQIPLILAWGITIHASQGATLDSAACDVGQKIFSPGQAYVALSRCRSIDSLTLVAFSPAAIRCDQRALAFLSRATPSATTTTAAV